MQYILITRTLACFVMLLHISGCTSDTNSDADVPAAKAVSKIAGEVLSSILDDKFMDSDRPQVQVDLDPASSEYGVIYLIGIDNAVTHSLSTLAPDAKNWTTFFKIYQHDTWLENPSVPPMMGGYLVGQSVIQFIPRFPLTSGLTYRVVFDEGIVRSQFALSASEQVVIIDTVFTVPQRAIISLTNVMQVYPSADILPQNLLKFYIHFSGSMVEGEAYQNLSLIDQATGLLIEDPFVKMAPELWDPERTRFTLFFDPGRIKRLVELNLELGPPLQVGHSYKLVVGKNWHDARGQVLQHDFEKEFHVVDADREMPHMDGWEVISPPALSRVPLILNFPEPLDHALLNRVIEIYDADEQSVKGMIELGNKERQWSFIPAELWEEKRYEIRVNTILEDIAGNTLRSLFDVDLQTAPPSEVREATAVKTLFFEVLPRSDTPS